MLTVETFAGSPPLGWDDTVCRLGGSIFHSSIWGDYQRATTGAQAVYVLARDSDGNERSGALALLRQSRHPVASLIFRDIELYAHPFARGSGAGMVTALLAEIEAVARRFGCRRLRLSSMMSGDSELLPGPQGYAETQRFEFVVDLTRSTDELWQGVRKDQRERIRRLDREGVTVEIGSTRCDIDGLRAVRESTQEKRVGRGQEYDLPADREFYDKLFDHLIARGGARLLLAQRNGETLAALFFLTFNGRACSMFSGSTALGYRLGAQSKLFWGAVEMFKKDGYGELNRGGVPASAADESDPQHGIYQFKLRLGTTPRLCRSGEKILSPMRDRLARLRDSLRALRSPRVGALPGDPHGSRH
jgi:GNAT superfamily N-acetyltransferase